MAGKQAVGETMNKNETTGMVFNIERYRIHDGTGIRTALFLKGCNLVCPWCCNPESQHGMGEVAIHKNLCRECGSCISVCPQKAISRSAQGNVIDRPACILCGACKEKCAYGAIEIYGEQKTVSEVMEPLTKDMAFFMRSQGGVTVSGGEPTLQADFVNAVMRECKNECLYTALETCGLATWENMWKCCEYCDEILFDIKTLIPQQFAEIVAGGIDMKANALEVVKNNVRELCRLGKKVVFRCVIIPGFNDNAEHIARVVAFAKENGVKQIDLLPFHQYGKHKYASLGMEYRYRDEQAIKDEEVEGFVRQIEENGILCTIGG